MKRKILTKTVSVLLAAIMLFGSLNLASVTTVFADETNKAETNAIAKAPVTTTATLMAEMATRSPIKKDRSAGAAGPYAVYVDGELRKTGQFSEVWNLAMDLAAYVKTDEEHSNEGRSKNVEFVLYYDMRYDASWFGEETMTISNRIFTIDLNGHLLHRTDKDGSVIKVTDNSILTIMDSNPTREILGYELEHKLWAPFLGTVLSEKPVTIKGGVISGGYYKTGDGGGIYADGQSTIYLLGGTIAGNKADVGSAVCLEGGSKLDMSRGTSQICYNYAAGTTSDGGAIFLRSDSSVVGGYVHHNLADDYGGGIRAKGGNITIKDVAVFANEAEDYGGGLYLERSWIDQIITVSGCRIIDNKTTSGGGGVYIYDLESVSMNDCIVEGNEANKDGAGICVSDWVNTDLAISGRMLVRNNYLRKKDKNGNWVKSDVKSNLYLESDNDLIVGDLTMDSEVWIRTEIKAEKFNGSGNPFLAQPTNASQLHFFADEPGYCVKYQDDPAKGNYRYMYLEKGTRADDALKLLQVFETKQQETPYKIASGDYEGKTMPLYKGYFEYETYMGIRSASPFYYSDGYFFEDPAVYNKHLATMSINLASAAYGRSTNDVGENTYANHFANVKQLFADIGCSDVNFFANDAYQIEPAYYGGADKLSTIGVAISQKDITLDGETYTLVPVAVRGFNYGLEWASNVTIGSEGEAKGFADAATQVYGHIQDYIANYGLSEELAAGKIKFWVVGYSRAGATANLTSKRLVDNFGVNGNQVYGYTFGTPMGGDPDAIDKELAHTGYGTYPTIHNTINELDFVSLVAPVEMGFIRYGVDHLIGSTGGKTGVTYDTSSTYYKQRMMMIKQLNAINPYLKFNDSWQEANLFPILSNFSILGINMIETDQGLFLGDEPNEECANMYEFLRWFFLRVQKDGLNVSDNSKIREAYATDRPLAGFDLLDTDMTVEEAVVALMRIAMSSEFTTDKINQLTDLGMSNFNALIGWVKSIQFYDPNASILQNYRPGSGWMADALIESVIMPIWRDIKKMVDVYNEVINDWCNRSEDEKANTIYRLMNSLLGDYNDKNSIWGLFEEEQRAVLKKALPVVLWFALNYASADYQEDVDDGMWGIGTFLNNMTSIVSNHYPEVAVAWVRSYDDYYTNDLQAYTLDTSAVTNEMPIGSYASTTKTLELSAKPGSSIFYSVDNGQTWEWYTKSVSLNETPTEDILCFSIYRGVKSEVNTISLDSWGGSIFGNGNIWFLIASIAVIVGFSIVGIELSRKKKKKVNE